MDRSISILGIRGIPGAHGGFETFVEQLAPYLVKKGWKVMVYCQIDGVGSIYRDSWNGVTRINIPVKQTGPLGSVIFDFISIVQSLRTDDLMLTLGYNTALFNSLHRVFRKKNVINMDGIEWRRGKWGRFAKLWFWMNERFGCWFGNHLIADNPRIEDHLATRINRSKITMIPYGAAYVSSAEEVCLSELSIEKLNYSVIIARPEPENLILEIVKAFSSKVRNQKLVVLGNFESTNLYHEQVMQCASEEVIFLGAIYDANIVQALRKFARFYVHGHTVGGTNPSLVEALGAGSAVIAHDNEFNRWVAQDAAIYFKNANDLESIFVDNLHDDRLIEKLRSKSERRFQQEFTWEKILHDYERLLIDWCDDKVIEPEEATSK